MTKQEDEKLEAIASDSKLRWTIAIAVGLFLFFVGFAAAVGK